MFLALKQFMEIFFLLGELHFELGADGCAVDFTCCLLPLGEVVP
jgi:hypothetical protein